MADPEKSDPRIIEIDMNKRYALILPGRLPDFQMNALRDSLRQWVQSDQMFLILPGDVRLEKLPDDLQVKE